MAANPQMYLTRSLAALALYMVTGCDGPNPGPVQFDVDLGRISATAVVFQVRALDGNAISKVTPLCEGCRFFSRIVNESETRGIVVDAFGIRTGPLVEVTVSDRRNLEAYQGIVVEVTDDSLAFARGDFTLAPAVQRSR